MTASKPYFIFCPQCGRIKLFSMSSDCITQVKDLPLCPSCKVFMRQGVSAFFSAIVNKFSSKKKRL